MVAGAERIPPLDRFGGGGGGEGGILSGGGSLGVVLGLRSFSSDPSLLSPLLSKMAEYGRALGGPLPFTV